MPSVLTSEQVAQQNSLFRQALGALFLPDEPPHSLLYSHGKDAHGEILDLSTVTDCTRLPSYWTLSTPAWYDAQMGAIDFCSPKWDHPYNAVKGEPNPAGHNFFQSRILKIPVDVVDVKAPMTLGADGSLVPQCIPQYAFDRPSPFIVFEIDRLLFTDEELKAPGTEHLPFLQAQAFAFAFMQAGFPFAVLVDSGSKSIHATVRLSDPVDDVVAWRKSPEFDRLVDFTQMAFGEVDEGVLQQSGKVRLVRTPGALRENGMLQQILAVGKPTTIKELTAWFTGQFTPATVQAALARPASTSKRDPCRRHQLSLGSWRQEIKKPHPAERGSAWFKVSMDLAKAGLRSPTIHRVPSAAEPYGRMDAAWLWWASAWLFNESTRTPEVPGGWFFSQDPKQWKNGDVRGGIEERTRWDGERAVEAAVDRDIDWRRQNGLPVPGQATTEISQVVQAMQKAQAEADPITGLPPPVALPPFPSHLPPPTPVGPPVDNNGNPIKQPKQKADRPPAFDPAPWISKFFKECIPSEHLIYLGELHGQEWWHFNGRHWERQGGDETASVIHDMMGPSSIIKHRNEVLAGVRSVSMAAGKRFRTNEHAVAFANGTLYVDPDPRKARFVGSFDPTDGIRTLIDFNYNTQAQCPGWQTFLNRVAPDQAKQALLQEMVGYVLLPQQPLQAFFLLIGTGANGKGVFTSVFRKLFQSSFVAVQLSALAGQFALGTVWDKRLCMDSDADALSAKGNSLATEAVGRIKTWTGGDEMKVEIKNKQAFSALMQPKLVISANRRPRFVDPSNGVWRRLKIIPFNEEIPIAERIPELEKHLMPEAEGILMWAVAGCMRLLANRCFTSSPELEAVLKEYEHSMDSTLQFMGDFMERNATAAWTDLGPIYDAYKRYCDDNGSMPSGAAEFRERLKARGVEIARPLANEQVVGIPEGGHHVVNGHLQWAMRGWLCKHPVSIQLGTTVHQPVSDRTIQFPRAR